MADSKPATAATIAANRAVLEELDFTNTSSFDDAQRGFIASIEPLKIAHNEADRSVFDLTATEFLEDQAPDTVNPSLWRQAQLNAQHHGLFEVVEGIYQVRSFDIANMTLIRGNTGWIVIDPLTSSETSSAALTLANKHLGDREVVAVVHTHSHADHFAGILGVVDPNDVASGKIPVFAPVDYVDEALDENVLAGNVMNRRATYMYGNLLETSTTGFITAGLGAALSMGSTGFIPPTETIRDTGETRTIDGVEFEFQMTMGTEAPAEMVFYFPQFKALCMSEITSHHLHNVYTPRGAQVRDALAWAAQINESIELFGDRLEVQFASHHWPIWGRDRALEFLQKQRDTYKYIHDQSLRLANHGYCMDEIAEQVHLPKTLAKEFYNRDYYGTVHHNSRAIYVKYLGYFDGNPSHLFQLPPTEAAHRYVRFMGGADAIVTKAAEDFDTGDYRWVAEVLDHVVVADPTHQAARNLLADALEQLGYQAESAPWRNFFLSGTKELRDGVKKRSNFSASEAMARGIPLSNLFRTIAVRLNGPKASAHRIRLALNFLDIETPWLVIVENGVLNAYPNRTTPSPTASLALTTVNFKRLMLGLTDAATLIGSGELSIDGDAAVLLTFAGLFDQFDRGFPLVGARPEPAGS